MLFSPKRSSIFQCSAATVLLPLSSPLSSFLSRATSLTAFFSSSAVQGCALLGAAQRLIRAAQEVVLLVGHARQQVAQVAQRQRREAHLDLSCL